MVVAFIGLCIVAVIFGSIIKIIDMSFKHHENILRIKHGYPTLSGDRRKDDVVVDYTTSGQGN